MRKRRRRERKREFKSKHLNKVNMPWKYKEIEYYDRMVSLTQDNAYDYQIMEWFYKLF